MTWVTDVYVDSRSNCRANISALKAPFALAVIEGLVLAAAGAVAAKLQSITLFRMVQHHAWVHEHVTHLHN